MTTGGLPNVPVVLPTDELPSPMPNVQNSAIMTPAELRQNYLWGIPTVDLKGVPIPDKALEDIIDGATAWFEDEVGISVRQRLWIHERKDFVLDEYSGGWATLRLNHTPILKIYQYLVIYPGTSSTVSYPLQWVQTDAEGLTGTLSLVPGVGSAVNFVIGNGGNMLPIIFRGSSYLPDLFKITYTSGFEANKTPDNIKRVIGKKAAVDVLTQVSMMLLGQGVVNQSLSIDGASQSSGKIPFIYQHQIKQFREQIKDEIGTLRSKYNNLRFATM